MNPCGKTGKSKGVPGPPSVPSEGLQVYYSSLSSLSSMSYTWWCCKGKCTKTCLAPGLRHDLPGHQLGLMDRNDTGGLSQPWLQIESFFLGIINQARKFKGENYLVNQSCDHVTSLNNGISELPQALGLRVNLERLFQRAPWRLRFDTRSMSQRSRPFSGDVFLFGGVIVMLWHQMSMSNFNVQSFLLKYYPIDSGNRAAFLKCIMAGQCCNLEPFNGSVGGIIWSTDKTEY